MTTEDPDCKSLLFDTSGIEGLERSGRESQADARSVSARLCERRSLGAIRLARPTGFEPVTLGFGNQYSIQLSYGRVALRIISAAVFERPTSVGRALAPRI